MTSDIFITLSFFSSWLMNLGDDKIMKNAKIAIGLHLVINCYEITMVRQTSLLEDDSGLTYQFCKDFPRKNPIPDKRSLCSVLRGFCNHPTAVIRISWAPLYNFIFGVLVSTSLHLYVKEADNEKASNTAKVERVGCW